MPNFLSADDWSHVARAQREYERRLAAMRVRRRIKGGLGLGQYWPRSVLAQQQELELARARAAAAPSATAYAGGAAPGYYPAATGPINLTIKISDQIIRSSATPGQAGQIIMQATPGEIIEVTRPDQQESVAIVKTETGAVPISSEAAQVAKDLSKEELLRKVQEAEAASKGGLPWWVIAAAAAGGAFLLTKGGS